MGMISFLALACELFARKETAPVALAAQALWLLEDPSADRALGAAGRALVGERYSLERRLPRLWRLFSQACL